MVVEPAVRSGLTHGLGMLLIAGALTATSVQAQSPGWSSRTIPLPTTAFGGQRSVVVALALDPTGQRVAVAGDDHTIRVCDLVERRVLATRTGHQDWVRSLDYSSDGRKLASVGNDGRLIVWETDALQPARQQPPARDEALGAVAFRPRTSLLATVGFGEPLRFFDTQTGASLPTQKCPCSDMRTIAFSPDGMLLAGGGRNGKIRIWDASSREVRADFEAHRRRIRSLEFSPDGKWLASCGEDRRVRIASVEDGNEVILPLRATKVVALAFIDSQHLATGGTDNVIRIWDLGQLEEVDQLTDHTGSITALAYRDGTLVSASYDTTVRIWQKRLNPVSEVTTPATRIVPTDGFEVR